MRRYENLCAQEAYFDVYGVGPKSGLYYYGTYTGDAEKIVTKLARDKQESNTHCKIVGVDISDMPESKWIGFAIFDEHGAEVAYASLNS